MQCPECGYEADDDACFCPKCRYQFRDAAGAPVSPGYGSMDQQARAAAPDDMLYEEKPEGFTRKELKMLDVQLLQPAILVVFVIAVFCYTTIMAIPFAPLIVSGIEFAAAGILSLALGLLAGIVFFFLARRSLRHFQARS